MKQIKEDRRKLAAIYPTVFAMPGCKQTIKRPLKIGIHKDILSQGKTFLPMWRIRMALGDYTRGRRYLNALLNGGMRIDLEGNIAGVVTDAERNLARASLAVIDEKREKWLASTRSV